MTETHFSELEKEHSPGAARTTSYTTPVLNEGNTTAAIEMPIKATVPVQDPAKDSEIRDA